MFTRMRLAEIMEEIGTYPINAQFEMERIFEWKVDFTNPSLQTERSTLAFWKLKIEFLPIPERAMIYKKIGEGTMMVVKLEDTCLSTLWGCTVEIEYTFTKDNDDVVIEKKDNSRFFCFKKSCEYYFCDEDPRCAGPGTLKLKIKVVDTEGMCACESFDFEKKGFSDVEFLVGGKKLYAHKSMLAAHSTYFQAMFQSGFRETNSSQIEIPNVEYEQFREMLYLIYPTNYKITVCNVECLLFLADMYDIQFLTDKCVKFLKHSVDITLAEKLALAKEYDIDELKFYCLNDNEPSTSCSTPKNGSAASSIVENNIEALDRMSLITVAEFKALAFEKKKKKGPKSRETTADRLQHWHNIVLEAEGGEIPANREYLAAHSPVFRKIFFEQESDSFTKRDGSRFKVEAKKEQLQIFLTMMYYDKGTPVNDKNYMFILELAEKFQVPFLMRKCENFLIKQKKWCDFVKLHIAEKFTLVKLQEAALKISTTHPHTAYFLSDLNKFFAVGKRTWMAVVLFFFSKYPSQNK